MFSLDWHICRILNDEGEPLTGRITIYNHNTLDKAALKSLEDGEYVDATNPYYIVDGVVTHSLFLADGLYDVVPEEYVGDAVDMTNDDEQSSWVAQRNWSIGVEVKIGTDNQYTQTNVYTIAALQSVDPDVSNVATVIGYWNSLDCEPRTYMWDANSTDTIDYGIVIGSNVKETGRWILVEDERILSTYYGVPYANTYTNQLFTYPSAVGTTNKLTPRKIVLTTGEYGDGSTQLIATNKIVEFLPGAKLKEGTNRLCCEQVIAGNTTIGDVTINYNKPAIGEVKSIWFYSVAGIAACNANKVIVDGFYSNIHKTNSFTKFSNITFELISDFIAPNDDEHPNGYFIFENCRFEGPGCLLMRSNDRYIGCIIDDSLFASHYINNDKDMFSACSAGNNWSSIESKLNGYYSMGYSAVDCYDMVEKNPRNVSVRDLTGSFTVRGVKTDKRMILNFNSLTLEDCESPDARITTYKNCKIYDSNLTGQINTILTATGSQNFNIGCTGNNLSGYWRIDRNTSATRNCRVTADIHDNTFENYGKTNFFYASTPDAAVTSIKDNKDFVNNEVVTWYNNKYKSNPDYGFGYFYGNDYYKAGLTTDSGFSDWNDTGTTGVSATKQIDGYAFSMVSTGHNDKDLRMDFTYLTSYNPSITFSNIGYIGFSPQFTASYRPIRTGGSNDALIYFDRQYVSITAKSTGNELLGGTLWGFTHQISRGR